MLGLFNTVARFVNAWCTTLPHFPQSEVSHSDYIYLLWLVQFETLKYTNLTVFELSVKLYLIRVFFLLAYCSHNEIPHAPISIFLVVSIGSYQSILQTKEKTALCSGYGMGLYEFCRMPFGLTGAPSSFQHLMDKTLQGL